MFEIKLEQFSGPLDKLLELIEAQKLQITEISIAAVTGDFIKYLEESKDAMNPVVLSDFLVVAAKLILIKSKTLLPDLTLTEEEEVEIKDLETRLTIYREFAARGASGSGVLSASQQINALWEKNRIAYSRPLFAAIQDSSFFYPSANLNINNLSGALGNLISEFKDLLPEKSKIKAVIISLEEKIAELLTRFKEAVSHTFGKLAEKKSKAETIVMFLAVLHLLRKNMIHVEQEATFGDIMIKKKA